MLACCRENLIEGRSFVRLEYPSNPIKTFIEHISEKLHVEKHLLETVALASTYVSPIIAVGKVRNEVKEPSVDEVDVKVDLNTNQWKLHFRIANYSVLDLYSWSVENAREIWFKRFR